MILLWWVLPVPCQMIAFLAVLIAASALQTPMLPHERRAVVSADSASNDALITPSARRFTVFLLDGVKVESAQGRRCRA